jgi:SNF2 family DNA or RNA helicase
MRQITLGNNAIQLHCHYEDREIAKTVPGHKWNKADRAWEYPIRPETYTKLVEMFPGVRVDRQVIAAVTQVYEREAAVAQAKVQGWEGVEPVEPMPIKSKPFQHQVLGFNLGLKIPNLGLLFEQGCGKTLTAIAVSGRRFLNGEIERLLVVAPSAVVPVWAGEGGEFASHADFPCDVRALEGPVEKRVALLESWHRDSNRLQVAVINYEATWRMEEALKSWKPDMIILDESQRIKTPGAQQSKAMHRLGKAAKYRMILTGTPVTQAPTDFFSQFKFLDQSIFGNSFYAFRDRYCTMGGFGGHQVLGYKNLEELTKKAHSISYRVTKAEALDLPEFIDQTLYCKLEPKAASIYNQLLKESVAELSADAKLTVLNVLSKLLRLSQIAGGYVEGQQVSKAKLNLLDETLSDLMDAGKKVVVFVRFLDEIAAIRKMLEDKKIEHSWIAGEVKQSSRGEEVSRFQTDPKCKVFIAQIQTAGLGITLHAADTAIFYSLDFSFANYDQCRARIHRIGQRNICTYIHLIAQGTVDEKVVKALQKKRDVATEVVDNWRNCF